MAETEHSNQDQSELWNGPSGHIWVEMQSVLDRMLAPFEKVLIEAGLRDETLRVLDVGCGAGSTTLAAARCVGPHGSCVGADISTVLIDLARKRASMDGVGNVEFVVADAQTHAFQANVFDAVISRFGVMFFDDPVKAFTNIRRATRSDARLTFVAWRTPAENPFMTTAARAAAPFLPPFPAPDPNGPGQFGFADGDRVRRILESSGWTGIDVRPIDVPSSVGEADLMAYVTKLGPVGLALREADEQTRAQTVTAVHAAFQPFIQDGAARFTSACWLVSARN